MILIMEPPPEYVHPFAGTVIERRMSKLEARALCALHGMWAPACSWFTERECIIVIPQGWADSAAIKRHELAHCNGWPASHPGGHYD